MPRVWISIGVKIAAAWVVAACLAAPAAGSGSARPPVTWLKGEGNFTKAHRSPSSIRSIVVHVTEGAFWGSVQWLKNPRAHASSHFVVARSGEIVQLVHLSDIAWHSGNWKVNVGSVGIEHEGFTYGRAGFSDAQYERSARLTAWLARRALMPIDRRHIIGHADVPGPRGGRGGASHHTDPGPHWNWSRYLELVRRYALGREKLSVVTKLRPGSLAGIVPWRAATTGGVHTVEFVVNGRVASTDRRPPFAFGGGRGLNTTRLRNGAHQLELRAYGDGTRHDITRQTVIVANDAFRLTTSGPGQWTRVRGNVRLRVRPSGAEARSVSLRVNGETIATDSRPPFLFIWKTRRVRDRMHVLELAARSVDDRVATHRIPLVVRNHPLERRLEPKPEPTPKPKPKPTAKPKPAPKPKPTPKPTPTPLPKPVLPPLEIVAQSVLEGQRVEGLVLWRVFVAGRVARVEFIVDGVTLGADLAAPYTLGWNSSLAPPGPHTLTARALGSGKPRKIVTATVGVNVPAPPASDGSGAP